MTAVEIISEALEKKLLVKFDYVGSDMSIKRDKIVAPIEVKEGYLYGRYPDAKDEKDIRRFLIDGIQKPSLVAKVDAPLDRHAEEICKLYDVIISLTKRVEQLEVAVRILVGDKKL